MKTRGILGGEYIVSDDVGMTVVFLRRRLYFC